MRLLVLLIVVHLEPFCVRAIYLYCYAFRTSLFLRILDLYTFAHFGPLYLLRIMDLYIFCALWTFLLLRILNSINYDCPCIHFMFAHIILSISRIFFYNHHSSIRALFYISRISSIFPLIRASLHFANIIHLFINQVFFCISRISYIYHSLIRAFFAFREYHPSFH